MKTKEEATAALREFLPHLKEAIATSGKSILGESHGEGEPELAVVWRRKEGGGTVIARFGVEFVADIEALVGTPTHDEEMEAKAVKIVQTFTRPE